MILCGVDLHHTVGLLGHSDADVAVHALMDAIIGAMGLGDIGKHFPDTSKEFEGISSMVLLDRVVEIMKNNGYRIGNVDLTIIAQRPKIAAFIPEMKENLCNALEVDASAVNVKATTEEGLGFTGEGKGISAHAVALIVKK